MNFVTLLIATVLAAITPEAPVQKSPEAQASCYGCACTTECWRSGVCKEVCRDSCGRFCTP